MPAFAGIDVGGSGNTHVWIAEEGEGRLILKKAEGRGSIERLAKTLAGEGVLACALDAPLSYSLSSDTGDRRSDRLLKDILKRKGFPASVVMPVNSMSAVPTRGIYLARLLRCFIPAVVETHPRACMYLAGVPEDLVSSYKRENVISAIADEVLRLFPRYCGLVPILDGPVEVHGDVDAIVCSLVALLVVRRPSRLLRLTDPADCIGGREEGFAPFFVLKW